MLIEWIEADKFRNLSGKTAVSPGLNIFLGDNGQGKTNWLEATHILATTRSFKTAKLQEVIKFDEDLAVVRCLVRRSEDIHSEMQVVLQGNTKTLSVNGKREAAHGYLGGLHAVIFNAEELGVVRGNPDARRRFLDTAVVSVHPPYIQTLSDYNCVIKQKNALLQSAREQEHSIEKTTGLLEPWNQQLAAFAARVHRSRVRIVERLNEALVNRFFGKEEVSIRYVSSLEGKGDLADYQSLITERLKLRVQAEIQAGYSLIGTHRDELEILFDGRDLRKFGSAGQQRSALLVLQLANMAVYHSIQNEYPVFLLDDIDSELDYHRIGQLLEYLADKAQTFVTTSKESFTQTFGKGSAIFRISDGMATPEQPLAVAAD
ncbi:MAG: DNA replication/repair protein RecF [Blastocatellia bacterium]